MLNLGIFCLGNETREKKLRGIFNVPYWCHTGVILWNWQNKVSSQTEPCREKSQTLSEHPETAPETRFTVQDVWGKETFGWYTGSFARFLVVVEVLLGFCWWFWRLYVSLSKFCGCLNRFWISESILDVCEDILWFFFFAGVLDEGGVRCVSEELPRVQEEVLRDVLCRSSVGGWRDFRWLWVGGRVQRPWCRF